MRIYTITFLIALIVAPVASAQDLSTPSAEYCAELDLSGQRNARDCALVFYADLAEQRGDEARALASQNEHLTAQNTELTARTSEPVQPAAAQPVQQHQVAMTSPSYGYRVYYGTPVGIGIGNLKDAGIAAQYRNGLGQDIRVGGLLIPNGGMFTVVFDEAVGRRSKRFTATIYIDVLIALGPNQYTTHYSGRYVRSLPQGRDPDTILTMLRN
jgi:hypothetical protein